MKFLNIFQKKDYLDTKVAPDSLANNIAFALGYLLAHF